MKLLLTAIGKRVQLINHLKKSFEVIGADAGEFNAGRYFVSKFYRIPKANEDTYISSLLDICSKEEIKVLIPLYEGEFEKLAEAREKFKEAGTILLLSSKKIIDICKDKEKTYEYFLSTKVKLPKIYSDSEIKNIINNKNINKFPLIIKPRDGMGSSNVFKMNNIRELEFFKDYVENGIIQEFVDGNEYTVDILVDLKGNPIYVVPRKRIEVRSGEVVKSATVHDENIINATLEVINELNKCKDENGIGLIGPQTIQFFKTKDNQNILIEVNPRFGGGVPLSFEAGADYGKCIKSCIENVKTEFSDNFDEKVMVRYDSAMYL